MSHPKNTTGSPVAQDSLTTEVESCETPISNQGTEMLKVAAGIECRDAVEKARALSSGLGQICKHMHDAVNYGDLVCCDGLETLSFVAEAISALLWSVQKGLPSELAEREQA